MLAHPTYDLQQPCDLPLQNSASNSSEYISGLVYQNPNSFPELDQLFHALTAPGWANVSGQYESNPTDSQQWLTNPFEDQPSQNDPQQGQKLTHCQSNSAVSMPLPERSGLHSCNIHRPSYRKSAIPPEVWEAHKDRIISLFVNENKTLKEVMDHLELNSNFVASIKQYKTQLAQWGVNKYVPADLLPWMKWKMESRKQDEGKETRFRFHGQVYSNVALQRRLVKRKTDMCLEPSADFQKPDAIEYDTPSPLTQSPIVNTLSEPVPTLDMETLNSESVNDGQSNLSIDDINKVVAKCQTLQQEASSSEEIGDFHEAEVKYRKAFQITREASPETHKMSIIIAYQLAECCLRNMHFQEASDVLETILVDVVKKFGVVSDEAIEQAISIVNICDQWALLSSTTKTYIAQTVEQTVHKRIDPARKVSNNRERQQEYNAAVAHILHRLVQVCDANLSQLNEQALRCRISLLQTIKDQTQSENEGISAPLQQVLTDTSVIFRRILRSKPPLKHALLDSLILTAMCFIPYQLEKANDMFIRLEAEAQRVVVNEDDNQGLIELLLRIGISFQNEKKWELARSRFEHALTLCYRDRKLHREMIDCLEDSIRKRHFSVNGPSLNL